jgi:hypothetical protein
MINIYFLEIDNLPFYIGKTNNPTQREKAHKVIYGNKTTLNIIDIVPENQWRFWEKYYITLFKSWNFNLKNKNNGGGGPTLVTDIHREKMSKARIGFKHSEETKYKMSKPKGKEYGEKIRQLKNKPIIQYDKKGNIIQEWDSILIAIQTTQIKGIYNNLHNRSKSSGGFIWKYKSDLETSE